MNAIELEIEMKRHNENGSILADALGITATTFSNKKNSKPTEKGTSEFTQGEIMMIKERYHLSPERVAEIFFAS